MVLCMEQQPNKIKPMLLSALAQLSTCLIVWNFHIPNPNILLFVVLSAVLVKYGYAAGIVSGLITFLYTAFFFSTDHSRKNNKKHDIWIWNMKIPENQAGAQLGKCR